MDESDITIYAVPYLRSQVDRGKSTARRCDRLALVNAQDDSSVSLHFLAFGIHPAICEGRRITRVLPRASCSVVALC
eukprot:1691122-Pleurochrysis_carterae.AAC.1